MIIVAIAWLYVVVMIAAVSDSLLIAIVRLLFLGVLPVGLLLWIKLRQHRARIAADATHEPVSVEQASSATDGQPPDASKPHSGS
jgi:type VI protein secretion system component VasK